MNTSLFRKWWLVTLKGIFLTALGALLIVHPYDTIGSIVIFLGVTLLGTGTLITYFAYLNRASLVSWKWFLSEGIFDIVTGMVMLF